MSLSVDKVLRKALSLIKAGELAEAWDLGEGSLVEPVADGAGVREAYQAVIA